LRSPLYDIGQDLGYGEFYQYMKYFWIILLLIYILKTTRNIRFISWILVFVYFLLDDSLQIHEKIGGLIAKSLPPDPHLGLEDQDYGELIVTGAFGLLFFILLTFSYWRGSLTFKKISIDLIIFISALVFFGVFMDMVHDAVKSGWVIEEILGIIEDGGEMVVVSIILWYVFHLASCRGCTELFLYEQLRKPKTRPVS